MIVKTMNDCLINNTNICIFVQTFKRDRSNFSEKLILESRTHVVWDPTTTQGFAITRGSAIKQNAHLMMW